jgi:hypothetical protein
MTDRLIRRRVAGRTPLLRWLVVPLTRSMGGPCRTESSCGSPTSTQVESPRVPDRCQIRWAGAVPITAAEFTSTRVALRRAEVVTARWHLHYRLAAVLRAGLAGVFASRKDHFAAAADSVLP